MIMIERENEAILDAELIGNYSILINEQVISFKNVIIRVRIINFQQLNRDSVVNLEQFESEFLVLCVIEAIKTTA